MITHASTDLFSLFISAFGFLGFSFLCFCCVLIAFFDFPWDKT